jgi:hypothetical protein
MSKRLLAEQTALKKIHLSLILQSKSFNPKYITCSHCKFDWSNFPGGRPARLKDRWGFSLPDEKQTKGYDWVCSKYKNTPYHSYLRFGIQRTNAEGKVINSTFWGSYYWSWSPIWEGEKDELILVGSGTKYATHKVCRRFEACPR